MMGIFTRKTSYFRDMKKSYELRRVKRTFSAGFQNIVSLKPYLKMQLMVPRYTINHVPPLQPGRHLHQQLEAKSARPSQRHVHILRPGRGGHYHDVAVRVVGLAGGWGVLLQQPRQLRDAQHLLKAFAPA